MGGGPAIYPTCRHYRRHKRPLSTSDDLPWSQAIPYNVAERLLANYDARIEATCSPVSKAQAAGTERNAYVLLLHSSSDGQKEETRSRRQAVIAGHNMPSSMMHRLNLKFYTEIRRRRQHQGLRVRVLTALDELRCLIQACSKTGDRSGRVYLYLEELNRLYLSLLRHCAPGLRLRSANAVTLGPHSHETARSTVMVAVDGRQQQLLMRQTLFSTDTATSPSFDCAIYSKKQRRETGAQLDAVDPRNPCWVDYLVNDLTESEAHGLFLLVARSKIPRGTQAKYRTAIEEALALAFNRRGYALDPLESLRVCMYFLRCLKRAAGDQTMHFRQLLAIWRHAGRWCTSETQTEQHADDTAIGELRFKRWNNVASEALVWRVRGDLQGTCQLLGEWHGVWTRIMFILCPGGGRRGFVEGTDPLAYPFWRPKRPGLVRLHELTLSTPAMDGVLKRLAAAGLFDSAIEWLGLATSEIGVPVSASMFNIVLGGLANDVDPRVRLPPRLASLLVLTNPRALDAYRIPADSAPLAQVMVLLRGMARWNVQPDQFTLSALVRFGCRAGNHNLLRAVLSAFAERWQIVPSPQCWKLLADHGLLSQAQKWTGYTACIRDG
ncbi:hypothetical protein H4S02_001041 [Coemansia sp. RSA 2611]|nr:hypothetical protein H4S02_001041 [Coemansia sp. RSA 2611]